MVNIKKYQTKKNLSFRSIERQREGWNSTPQQCERLQAGLPFHILTNCDVRIGVHAKDFKILKVTWNNYKILENINNTVKCAGKLHKQHKK